MCKVVLCKCANECNSVGGFGMGWCSPDEFEGLGSSRVRGVQDAGRHTNERRARDLALWLQQKVVGEGEGEVWCFDTGSCVG